MKRLGFFLIFAAPLSAASAQSISEAPIKTTLCAVKAHPEEFQHKLVQFTATASHGFEDSMVEDSTCRWTDSNNPGVWMEFGGKQSTDTMYCCGLSPKPSRPETIKVDGIEIPLVDDELFKTFNVRLHPKHSKPRRESDIVRATLRGIVFSRKQSWGGNTKPYWGGYGHMGCCMLFVVTQVLAIDSPTSETP